MDAWIFQRGLFFLFVHWFNEDCCVEGGKISEEVLFVHWFNEGCCVEREK
jgi:hypothetical protein